MKKTISGAVEETTDAPIESQDKFGIVEKSTEEVEETVEAVVEEAPADEVVDSTEEAVEEVDEAGDVAETEEAVEEISEPVEIIEEKVVHPNNEEYKEAVETTKALADQMSSAINMLADTIKAVNSKVEELNNTVLGVQQEFAGMKDEFGKRVDAVEKDTAFRKSGDLGEVVQEPIFKAQATKSVWGGRFLTKSDLFA